ncbi:DMT family transporter [Pseudomonas vanderleydeniana]|uniref:DMT family transporter n=1 Tax=Pseudomonas vanderleydeniana TaxID=2745495 RepID=A0A9E6PRA8_9PSED|nr:DMT family transporter [Pseudomonas vanderleydeniana]QXI30758.1 DMT family transporter [Pseudomonas vanderleydeniana]
MSGLILALLVAAGAAVVAQNLLMVQITSSVSTVLITLLINSAAGFVILLSLLLGRAGLAGIGEAFGALRYWSLLPGLLGSFFVFASIFGYQRLGAAATISVLVASQLLVGLAVDFIRASHLDLQGCLSSLCGAVLLVAGAYLVASRHF